MRFESELDPKLPPSNAAVSNDKEELAFCRAWYSLNNFDWSLDSLNNAHCCGSGPLPLGFRLIPTHFGAFHFQDAYGKRTFEKASESLRRAKIPCVARYRFCLPDPKDIFRMRAVAEGRRKYVLGYLGVIVRLCDYSAAKRILRRLQPDEHPTFVFVENPVGG